MLEKHKVEEHFLRLPRITIKRNTLCFKWVENGIAVFVRGQTQCSKYICYAKKH